MPLLIFDAAIIAAFFADAFRRRLAIIDAAIISR